jgi:hypothetical protein
MFCARRRRLPPKEAAKRTKPQPVNPGRGFVFPWAVHSTAEMMRQPSSRQGSRRQSGLGDLSPLIPHSTGIFDETVLPDWRLTDVTQWRVDAA